MAETEHDPHRAHAIRKAAEGINVSSEEMAELRGTHANLYKTAEREHEIDRAMLKLGIKFAKMEAPTFAGKWAALIEIVNALGCFNEPALPLSKPAEAGAEAREDDGDEPAEGRVADEPAEARAAASGGGKLDLEEPGDARERGRRARLAGRDRVDSNMEPQGSVEAQQHDIGWGLQDQEMIDAAARSEPDNAAPKRKRGSGATDGNGAAAVH